MVSGHMNKTYGRMSKGYTGHFNRVCTGLLLEWGHPVYISWVKGAAAAPFVLLLLPLWDSLACAQLEPGKTNLPMSPWLSALTAAACSPCTPIEQTAAPPTSALVLSALTAADCRPWNPMKRGVGNAQTLRTGTWRPYYVVSWLRDAIREALFDDGRRRRCGIGLPPRSPEASLEPRTHETGKASTPIWDSAAPSLTGAVLRHEPPASRGQSRWELRKSSTAPDSNSSHAYSPRTAATDLRLACPAILLATPGLQRRWPAPPRAALRRRDTRQPTRGLRVQAERGLST